MLLDSITPENILARFDFERIQGHPASQRYLSDLKGLFLDEAVYASALEKDNPLLYSVSSVEPAQGDDQLHYGLGVLYPGKIGNEYYFTKGHYHAHRPAAEIYITLKGSGAMLLEDEHSHESRLVPMTENSILYVPGHTAHRTINIGDEPLSYIGIYPANAGHDYAPIARENFRKALVEVDGKPVLIDRNPRTIL